MSHNIQNYPNRFSADKNWQRVLFRPDKKSQAAEFHELQSLLNHQQVTNFSHLYQSYAIVRPIEVSILEQDPLTVLLSEGQVYFKTPQGGFFVDVPEQRLTLPDAPRIFIGVNPVYSIQTDGEELRDPITGGWISGDFGADRYCLKCQVVINGDAYPIALLHQIEGRAPLITYYSSEGYHLNQNQNFISKLLKDYLALRWYEESGDFIARGLELSMTNRNYLTISPGVAYLKGHKIERTTPAHFKLPRIRSNSLEQHYSVYLQPSGQIEITQTVSVTVARTSQGILLGSLEVDRNKYTYQVFQSQQRSLSNEDLLVLKEQQEVNEARSLQLALDQQTVDEGFERDIQLKGAFTDPFINSSKSDVFHPLYSASLIPSERLVRAGLNSYSLDFGNLTLLSQSQANIGLFNNQPFYLAANLISRTLISQSRSTSWISLSRSNYTVAAMRLSPDSGIGDVSNRTFGQVTDNLPTPLRNRALSTEPVLGLSMKLQANTIQASCYGFAPFEDNLQLTFGNIAISEFQIQGTTSLGSSLGTVKAAADGTVNLTFLIPNNLEAQTYTVSLNNDRASAAAIYRFSANKTTVAPIYQATGSAVAQTFQIETPLILTGVKIAVRSVNPNLNTQSNLAAISLVKTANGLPTEEVISQGLIPLSSVKTSNNGSLLTDVQFERPALIPTAGQYAISITPLVEGTELFFAQVNSPSLVDGGISGVQPLVGGEMIVRNGGIWISQPSQDLCFELIQGLPSSNQSEVILRIINPIEPIAYAKFLMEQEVPSNTSVQVEYLNGDRWEPLENYLTEASQEVDVKIKLTNTSLLTPIVKLDSAKILTQANRKFSSWISRTVQFDFNYENLEVSFNYHLPEGASLQICFSSNAGETWEPLYLESTPTCLNNAQINQELQSLLRSDIYLTDSRVPLYKATFRADLSSNPTTNTVDLNGNALELLRKQLTIRVDFEVEDPNAVPYIQRLASLVY